MITSKDITEEIKHRISADIEHFGGTLPERTAIAWRGYLAATLEWNILTIEEYDSLLTIVPSITDDPAVSILRGRD